MTFFLFLGIGDRARSAQLSVGKVKGPDVKPWGLSQGADRKRQHSTPLFSTNWVSPPAPLKGGQNCF